MIFKRQEGAHAHEQPTLPNRSLLRGLIEAQAGKVVMLLLGRRARVLERTSTTLPIGDEVPEQRSVTGTLVGVRPSWFKTKYGLYFSQTL